jgi:beta-barrel assembly-enhancing protease
MSKKLIPAEILVASSLLLAPCLALTGYGQNSPQSSPPAATPSNAPPAASTPPGPATDATMPGVKPGSIDDVNAVGTRDIGARGMGNWYSTETEIGMGKSYSMQLAKSVKFIDDPVVVEYVNRIAQNLVKNSDAKVPFTIKVIDSDEVNAMALPGGFMFVNSGLILTADDEAEMAGVIAHEIAHVAAHHAVREQTRMNYAQLGTIPLIFIGGWTGYGIYEAAQIGIPLTFLQFSRGFESQADFLGVQYMYRAGYDPQAFVTIFEKLENLEKTKPHLIAKAFSSHPQTPDRIEATQKEIATLLPPRAEYVVTTSEFDDVKARLARIENKRKLNDGGKGNQPTLRRASSSPSDPNAAPAPDSSQPGNDRPTLQRRDDN